MVSMDTLPPHLQEKEIEQFRFPEPTLTRNPVACAQFRESYMLGLTMCYCQSMPIYASCTKKRKDESSRTYRYTPLKAAKPFVLTGVNDLCCFSPWVNIAVV